MAVPATIPYFHLPVYEIPVPGLGTLPIDPWATLVMIGFVVGLEVGRARAIKQGLDVRDYVDGAVFTVLVGFVVAHIYTVLFYFPERLQTDGIWSLLRVWEGFSSTGGIIGAVIGANIFHRWIRPGPMFEYLECMTYGFPFGWFFGRLGCASVHDHIGRKTDFFLAMRFPPEHIAAGVRHELGLYEAIYMIGVCVAFALLGRRPRPSGFYIAAYVLMYMPIRIALDFLRNDDLVTKDARYWGFHKVGTGEFGLTPAQVGMFAIMVVALGWLWWRRSAAVAAPPPPPPVPAEAP
jgi:phosphatidylglycerol:prolipoprotein diacylglycerol transferase